MWSPEEWYWFARAWGALLICFFRFRTLPYAWIRSPLQKAMQARPASDPPSPELPLLKAFDRACRLNIVPRNCLREALVLHHLLLKDQYPTQLRIGVKPGESLLHAHAWLEAAGQPLAQQTGQLAGYIPMEGPLP